MLLRPSLPIDWVTKLRFFLQVMAFALAVSAIQYAFQPERPYEVPMRYSLCISFFTWATIDFGRHYFPSSNETGWPQGWSTWLLPLVGIVLGYLAGTLLGDWWCGWPGGSFAPEARGQLRNSLIVTALAGLAGTYYFYSAHKGAYLERKMAEARQQAAHARLKMLETQLEPHMMFNTLANLRVLISVDPEAAQRMLDHMISYLRATLGASRSTVHSLQAEFDRLRDYLELMKVRMGPRLHYQLALPPALQQVAVPTLLLQPLVENSLKHGLEPKIEGGSIQVQAVQTEEDPRMLVLTVSDSGVGMGAPRAEAAAGSGFGLGQVRERLLTAYGPLAQLHIEARPDGGTCVTLHLPLSPLP